MASNFDSKTEPPEGNTRGTEFNILKIFLGFLGFISLSTYAGFTEAYLRDDSFISMVFQVETIQYGLDKFFLTYLSSFIFLFPLFFMAAIAGAAGGILSSVLKIGSFKEINFKSVIFLAVMISILVVGLFELESRTFTIVDNNSSIGIFLLGIGVGGLISFITRNNKVINKAEIGMIGGLCIITAIMSIGFGMIFPVPVGILGYLAVTRKKISIRQFLKN